MLQKYILSKGVATSLTLKEVIFISCAFSCLLLVGRAVITGFLTYVFLLWNLFLAIIPYAITQWLAGRPKLYEKKVKFAAVVVIWLLFIPNSFYILTDLFHLDKFESAPEWFDLLLLFSFAWNGLLLGILSVRTMERVIETQWIQGFSAILLFVVMWVNAFGVYIGRYLRFNSWDIIVQPFSLFDELFEVLFHPLQNKMELGMITVYAVFMMVFYITIKKLSENFHKLNQ